LAQGIPRHGEHRSTSNGGPVLFLTATQVTIQTDLFGPATGGLISVFNAGTGVLDTPVIGALTYLDDSGWMTTPTYINGAITFSVDPDGLPVGAYAVQFPVSSAGASNSPQVVTITMVVVDNTPPASLTTPDSTLDYQVDEGAAAPANQTVTLVNGGAGILDGPTTTAPVYTGGSPGWIVSTNITGPAADLSYTCTVVVDHGAMVPGTYGATFTVLDANAPEIITVTVSLIVVDVVDPAILAVSPTSLSLTAFTGQASPANQTLTITTTSGPLAGPTIAEVVAQSWIAETVPAGNPFTTTVSFSTAGLAAGVHTVTLRISDANALATVDVPVTVTVTDLPVAGLYPATPTGFNPPIGVTKNRVTNIYEGSNLQVRYYGLLADGSTVDNTIPIWINTDTTPSPSTSRMTSAVNTAVTNMSILQEWVTEHANQGIRRGYEYANTREFEGQLVLQHNAGTGWSGFRPIGYTYDPTLETPRTELMGGPVFRSIAYDKSTVRTATTGGSDPNHGRYAIFGHQITATSAVGPSINLPCHQPLVKFGSTGSDQNTTAKMPQGFLLHDCCVRGVPRYFFRRGVQVEGLDVEIRAVLVTEIHNSYNFGADNGISQDAQAITGWNCSSRVLTEFSIFHGGDEGFNSGGAGALIPGGELEDWWFNYCEFSANDVYLFNTPDDTPASGPIAVPSGTLNDAFWQKKNCVEMKRGRRFLFQFCRVSGIRSPNNNQGYAFTIKVGTYGGASTPTPLQTTEDVIIHGCWVERCPAMFGYTAFESIPAGTPGVEGRRIAATDCFGWEIGVAPYAQNSKRLLVALNDTNNFLDNCYFDHITIGSSTTTTNGVMFGTNTRAPNLTVKNVIAPYASAGVFSNDNAGGSNSTGSAAFTALASPTTPTVEGLVFVRSSPPSQAYPTGTVFVTNNAALGFVDLANKDMTIASGNRFYAGNADGASDGWNRGVSNPAVVKAQIDRCPTILVAADYTP
jgi:hypothetical protein